VIFTAPKRFGCDGDTNRGTVPRFVGFNHSLRAARRGIRPERLLRLWAGDRFYFNRAISSMSLRSKALVACERWVLLPW
jgi:hypothetical protein